MDSLASQGMTALVNVGGGRSFASLWVTDSEGAHGGRSFAWRFKTKAKCGKGRQTKSRRGIPGDKLDPWFLYYHSPN